MNAPDAGPSRAEPARRTPPRAIVTGATRAGRVGLATAIALARSGCDVLLTHRGEASAAEGALHAVRQAAPDVQAEAATLDLERPDEVEAWAAGVAAGAAPVDVLVHNASIYEPTPLASLDVASAERFFRVNALAPLLLSKALAAKLGESPLPGGGAIVTMCDIHAMGEIGQPRRDFAAYAMSKAALLEMTMVLARSLAPRVRVNAVAPGVVAFPPSGHESDAEAQQAYLRRVPLGRSGTPQEAAEAVRWLALEATYCTGQVIRVDGGRFIT